MTTPELIEQLFARLRAESEEKGTLGRWLALIIARLGGTVVLTGPDAGEFHLINNHRCARVHGSQCADTLILHDGPPEACRTLLCVESGAAVPPAAPAARRTRAEERMLAAEARQRRPELN